MNSRASFDAAQSGRADTLVSRFLDRASRDPERVAYTSYPMGALNALGTLRWGEWAARARAVSGSLLALHLERGARVALYTDNRELWPVALMGVAMTGAVAVPISPDATHAELMAQLRDSEPAVVVVDTIARLKILRQAQAETRQTFTMVCDDLEPLRASTAEGLSEWDSWLKAGALALQDYEPLRHELAKRVEATTPQDIFTILYKPGTQTGVMYSHDAVLAMAAALTRDLGFAYSERVAIAQSFSHGFECAVGIFATIYAGTSVALVERADDTLRAARLHESTIVCGSEAVLHELNHHLSRARMQHENLREAASLQAGTQCHMVVLESDGLATDTERDLHNAGIALTTVYGVAEQRFICRNGPQHWRDDSIGEPFSETELRIDQHGQLQVRRGPMSSAGYFRREHEFQQQLTPDGGWLCTGDCVERVHGAMRLVGTVADLIMLPGGAAISTRDIESALCALPHVAHAICLGAPDKPLVAVLSLRRKEVEAWARSLGIVAPWAALVEHPLVYEQLARGIADINQRRDPHERVSAFAPTELEFSVHTGELDDAGQLNRAVLLSRFEHVFADLHHRLRY